MLYTLFVFTFGVYVGQEYNDVPNVRTTVNRAMRYLKDTESKDGTGGTGDTGATGGTRGAGGTDNVPKSMVEIWKSFFDKPKND
jgi:hypothetical protein